MPLRDHRWLGRAALLLLGLYWMALGTSTHIPTVPRIVGHTNDKLLHFGAYLILTLMLCATVATHRKLTWKVLLAIYSIVIGYGMVDELFQIPIAGRQADLLDWLADAAGAATGIALVASVRVLVQKVTRKGSALGQETVSAPPTKVVEQQD